MAAQRNAKMTPERWRQIEEIYQQALELSPEARPAFLQESCKTDPSLRNEIEALLTQTPGETIERSIRKTMEVFSAATSSDFAGMRIGNYRLRRLIGQGGMGSVYEAVRDDEQFQKKVAIKLIRRGMDTDLILKRFRHERQILATLEHPYIAHLLDGGTTEDGLPFFVMEFIEGSTITIYSAKNDLSIGDRLKLFRLVCEAVQHAHRNLIVHRDIKPGNILVTEDGMPKLLDFGIAKLLHSDSPELKMTQTAGAFPAMTPDYASPEQMRGDQVSTATDIYSLGVVLYELLTGTHPYDLKNHTPREIEKVISTTQPEKPSAVLSRTGGLQRFRRQLSGDLDNIVLMALRKEPERRYSSVEQFSDDIRRHLEGLPVTARKDTLGYHAGKFIIRHKLSLAAVALVILSLIAGIVVALREARRADNEARRAEHRFEQVRKLAHTFLFDFHDNIRDLPGSTKAREMVVTTALEYLDNLSREAENDPSLQMDLAVAYQKVGDVQGNPWGPNLGHTKDAMDSYRKGLALAERLAEGRSDLEFLRNLANGYFKLGALQSEAGKKGAAGKTLDQAKNVAEKLLQKSSAEDDLILMAEILTRVGDVQLDSGNATAALKSYQRMQGFMEHRAALYPSKDAQSDVATSYSHVGESQASLGNLSGAMDSYRRSLNLLDVLIQKDPTSPTILRRLRVAHTWLGHLSGNPLFINQGDRATAVLHFQEAVSIATKMTEMDPKNARARQDLAIDNGNLADVLSDSDPARAADLHQKALEITESLLQITPGDFLQLRRKAYFLRGLGVDLRNQNNAMAARNAFLEAKNILKDLSEKDPSNMVIRRDLHVILTVLGDVQLNLKEFENAFGHLNQALSLAEKSASTRPEDPYRLWELADSYSNLGRYYSLLPGQEVHRQKALDYYQKSLILWDSWPAEAKSTSFVRNHRLEVSEMLKALQ